jgi:hypothetical protein
MESGKPHFYRLKLKWRPEIPLLQVKAERKKVVNCFKNRDGFFGS